MLQPVLSGCTKECNASVKRLSKIGDLTQLFAVYWFYSYVKARFPSASVIMQFNHHAAVSLKVEEFLNFVSDL